MDDGQPGLSRRLGQEARRISSQHERLDSFYELVADAIRKGEAETARLALTRLCDALDAHFALEEKMYFPAVHGLCPELRPKLHRLVDDHGEFRSELDRLGSLVAGGDLPAAGAHLEALAGRLAAHEREEERLMAEVVPQPPGATPR